MVTLIKAIAALIAGFVAILAALFGVASAMAWGSDDPVERKQATFTAFWSLVTFALCAAAIITLSGCVSYEGAGFTNSGRPRNVVDCVRTDARGNQVWFSVPAGRSCPR